MFFVFVYIIRIFVLLNYSKETLKVFQYLSLSTDSSQ